MAGYFCPQLTRPSPCFRGMPTPNLARALLIVRRSESSASLIVLIGPCCSRRERKRAQMATMQIRVEELEAVNANLSSLLSARDAELAALRQQLAFGGAAR